MNVGLDHLYRSRNLWIMTISREEKQGFFKKPIFVLENYVSINGVSWLRMPDKEPATPKLNKKIVELFQLEHGWELVEDMHAY